MRNERFARGAVGRNGLEAGARGLPQVRHAMRLSTATLAPNFEDGRALLRPDYAKTTNAACSQQKASQSVEGKHPKISRRFTAAVSDFKAWALPNGSINRRRILVRSWS